ncbi:hypothetical protein O6H91_Y346900 [Diphasiastrum complanatum]|nr:hypothetical protein O6H91_Y346900 [Diphasiastrum complanatum]
MMERSRDAEEEEEEERDGDGDGGASASDEEEMEVEGGEDKSTAVLSVIRGAAGAAAGVSPSQSSSSSYSHNNSNRASAHSSGGGGGAILNWSDDRRRKMRRRLHEDLKTVKGLIARLEARERFLSSKEFIGGGGCEKGQGQGSGSGGEGADSAQPSSYSGQEGAGATGVVRRDSVGFAGKRRVAAGDAFTKERSAVGARMALASNGSADSRGRGKRKESESEVGNHDFSGSKRPKRADPSNRNEQTQADLFEGDNSRGVDLALHPAAVEGMAGFGTRPEAVGPDRDIWSECMNILDDLLKSRNAWAFEKPVLVIWPHLFDYSNRIKTPMDLGTVKSKLQSGEYSNPQEFAADVRLTFTNALAYNEEGSMFYNSAQQMKLRFDSKFRSVDMKLAKGMDGNMAVRIGNHSSQVATVTGRPPDSGVLIQSGAATQRKILPGPVYAEEKLLPTHMNPGDFKPRKAGQKTKNKVQRPDKPPNSRLGRSTSALAYGGVRPLTAKEREKLPTLIESLPADRVKKVIEILKQRNPACLESATGEVELDLGKFDEETMFELHRLAMNWQKSKKKVLSRLQPSEGLEELVPNNGNASLSGKDHSRSPVQGRDQITHAKLQQNKKDEDNGGVRASSFLDKEKVIYSSRQEISVSASDSSSSSGSSSASSSSSDSGSDSESDADSDQSSQKA